MTKTNRTVKIDGYKVHGNVLIPNGTGPRKAYILRAGYLANPVTAWFHRNARVSAILPHILKTEYHTSPFAFSHKTVFRAPNSPYRAYVYPVCSTYKLANYADGGTPLVYLTERDECLCADCATKQATRRDNSGGNGYRIVAVHPHYEGAPIDCDACNVQIESAYGGPDEESEG